LQDEGFLNVRHGAGAVVSARRAGNLDENELRKPLRTALTQLILAGRTDREIVAAVRSDLESLRRKGESR
jgi:DNA-binding transcriptional regulator YhcF (GntR family)